MHIFSSNTVRRFPMYILKENLQENANRIVASGLLQDLKSNRSDFEIRSSFSTNVVKILGDRTSCPQIYLPHAALLARFVAVSLSSLCLTGALVGTYLVKPLSVLLLVPVVMLLGYAVWLHCRERQLFHRVNQLAADSTNFTNQAAKLCGAASIALVADSSGGGPPVAYFQMGEVLAGQTDTECFDRISRSSQTLCRDVAHQVREAVAALYFRNDSLQVRAALKTSFDLSWYSEMRLHAYDNTPRGLVMASREPVVLHGVAVTSCADWLYFANAGLCQAFLIYPTGVKVVTLEHFAHGHSEEKRQEVQQQVGHRSQASRSLIVLPQVASRQQPQPVPQVTRLNMNLAHQGLIVLGPPNLGAEVHRDWAQRLLKGYDDGDVLQTVADAIVDLASHRDYPVSCMVIDARLMNGTQANWSATAQKKTGEK